MVGAKGEAFFRAIAAIASIAIAGAVCWIAWNANEISSQQTKILEQQTELMGLQYAPVIDI